MYVGEQCLMIVQQLGGVQVGYQFVDLIVDLLVDYVVVGIGIVFGVVFYVFVV